MMRALPLVLAIALLSLSLMHWDTVHAAPVPVLHSPLYPAIVGEELTLRGTGLGDAAATRSVRFDYDGTSTSLDAASASIIAWSSTEVRLRVPMEVRSGQVRVIVDGTASATADTLMLELTTYPLPAGEPGTLQWPLAIDVDASQRVWVIEEDHTHLKWVLPQAGSTPAMSGSIAIPEAPGVGIFAKFVDGSPAASRSSAAGEDVDVASDGSVWFTQGGAYLYEGDVLNTSRIVRYIPGGAGQFQCYPVPTDDAEVLAVLVDETTGRVWYTESDLEGGNAISSFNPLTTPSNCLWDPYTDSRPSLCSPGETEGCHDRFVLPEPNRSPAHLARASGGMIWFTEFWGSRIGRFDPETETVIEIPLGVPIVRDGPGLFAGSGPWEIDIDEHGAIWVSDYFDATVVRIDPALVESQDCTHLDANGSNPCVEDMFVGSDGYDLRTLHTVTTGSGGRVWFTHDNQVGLISAAHQGAVALVEIPSASSGLAGIVEEPTTGSVWFAMFMDHSLGRLREARGDLDGLDGPSDNCPNAYNPDQINSDRDFVDLSSWNKPFNDLTWPASDQMGDACDDDADNDGLNNDVEELGCPPSSAPTDPHVRDSDNDLILDGPECALGSDPMNPASRPLTPAANDPDRDQLSTLVELFLGTDPGKRDTDGDKVYDGVEYLSYGSSPTKRNTDGDACADAYEAASVNTDKVVSSLDLLIVALSYGTAGGPKYVRDFDVNRDGAINATDLALAALTYGFCTPN